MKLKMLTFFSSGGTVSVTFTKLSNNLMYDFMFQFGYKNIE